jgi:hypothetical protein|nr:MAG TPA: hypothetical protein [Caudoviricetes sp.]
MSFTMMRYIGDGDVLEYGRVYNCRISAFSGDSTNCNITVEVSDPSKDLIAVQILYSSIDNYLMDWKSV